MTTFVRVTPVKLDRLSIRCPTLVSSVTPSIWSQVPTWLACLTWPGTLEWIVLPKGIWKELILFHLVIVQGKKPENWRREGGMEGENNTEIKGNRKEWSDMEEDTDSGIGEKRKHWDQY